jgi:hypothetical protein
MSLLIVESSAYDGNIQAEDTDYEAVHSVYEGDVNDSGLYSSVGQAKQSNNYIINRSFFHHNTSDIPSGKIPAWMAWNFVIEKDDSDIDFDITLQKGSEGQPSMPLDPDETFGSGYYEGGDLGSLSTAFILGGGQLCQIILSDMSVLNPGGYTSFAVRSSRDISFTPPTEGLAEDIQIKTYEAGAAYWPQLTVIYYDPSQESATYGSLTADGNLEKVDADYETGRSATAGTVQDTGPELIAEHIYDGENYVFSRPVIQIDTSGLASNRTVVEAYLLLFVTEVADVDCNLIVQDASLAHDTLEAGDYNKDNYSGNGGSVNLQDLKVGVYNVIPLNSTGCSWIKKGQRTKLVLRFEDDIGDVAPTDDTQYAVCYSQESGANVQPKLIVVTEESTVVIPVLINSILRKRRIN